MIANKLSEFSSRREVASSAREILEKFERAKLLEIYFSRLDGRIPVNIPSELSELYKLELPVIKAYLLGQHPHDSLLQQLFRIMH